MKRSLATTLMVAASITALSGTSPASAEEPGTPFIKAEYWKENISHQEFKAKPRTYFRSERAFDLMVGYVSGEIGQNLTGSQFIALMRSDQVRARACSTDERITTGFLRGEEFDWETRFCRVGEQIVQYRLGDRWIDLFSLNCLNAVEDQIPVPPPTPSVAFRYVPPPAPPVPMERPQKQTIIWRTPDTFVSGTVIGFGCICCGLQSVIGTPSIHVPGSVSQTTDFGF
jgi:hypothetical protein